MVLLPVLAGCSTLVTGRPVPAAGFAPSAPEHRDPSGPVARTTAGTDPCTLLTPDDLEPVGGADGPPHPDNPLPGACTQMLGAGPGNSAGAGFHEPLDAARDRQPEGTPVEVDGHAAWLYCAEVDGFQTCTATTGIAPERSLLTLLSVRGASAADTAGMLHGLTSAALHKLPPA
ncbi:DUF3558 domain-containing protein [Saccharopolyspora sp. HNM0983]|uniref:DUF3558 domain-containing protein n=1 Tax=Saccharopolyspora montiporae TaxID=2781240 RepID=A0A929BB61_9PSEU|nr:DUF3558 domain-containing protein [Saccharopolyspora sp. HNM0983]MBE9374463.1 DUF3558 domain-containing protein [Saccharopolyspora sp. HNM0983]